MALAIIFTVTMLTNSRQLRHEEWLERERKAQEDFRQKKEKEDTKLKEREEREVSVIASAFNIQKDHTDCTAYQVLYHAN